MANPRDLSALPARAFRMTVDAGILIVAFTVGVAVDYFWRVDIRDQEMPAFSTYLTDLLPSLPLLILTALVVFSLTGFYTRRRFYRHRYKAVAVVQGTAVAYLLYTSEAYALRAHMTFPAAVAIVMAAVVSLTLMLIARIYSYVLIDWLSASSTERGTDSQRSPRKSILVIGGAGYIGSALLPLLLKDGYRVRVLDALLFGQEPIAPYVRDGNVELVEGDFRRIDQLVTAMKDVDEVVHLGGLVGDPACAVDEDLTIEINVASTRTVSELARAHGVKRFVFASTCSVYGASDEFLDEHSKLNPVSLYARSKIASERALQELSTDAFRPTVLRFGTVYGLSGRTRFDLVVNLLTAQAAIDGVITVFGPDQWRPFVHVADVAKAILCTLHAPGQVAGGRVFNVGSNEQNVTLGELGTMVRNMVPSAELLVGDMDGDRRNYRVNFNRIADELKFVPDWTLEQGIHQVLEYLTSDGNSQYTADKFSNFKVVRDLVTQSDVSADRQRDLRLLESKIGFEDDAPLVSPSTAEFEDERAGQDALLG